MVTSVMASLHLGQHFGDHSCRQHLHDAGSSAVLVALAAAHAHHAPAALAGTGQAQAAQECEYHQEAPEDGSDVHRAD